ncbi:hypothetical protein NIE88_20015 [Sporolactobacillus shoreicorticis]|uniref:Flagellar hook-length control protein FliK n=1 Tax=Sporolactobacillus shoreicorticis TaxID=1923877 RepID=A0ABW5RZD1_9BACL|nr:hypothetical protein [Sporolactobacillus shoreicorticis]MCO7128032.1 hypothetical protein [Sporolactobacillus shoreicorticis]
MTVSLNSALLNYLSQIENSNSAATPASSTDIKELSSEFAQLLASSLMSDSASQMLGTLSSTDSDLENMDANDLSNTLGTSTQSTDSVEDLLWHLLSSAANNSTNATTTVSGTSV